MNKLIIRREDEKHFDIFLELYGKEVHIIHANYDEYGYSALSAIEETAKRIVKLLNVEIVEEYTQTYDEDNYGD
jgi:hypothetical protein